MNEASMKTDLVKTSVKKNKLYRWYIVFSDDFNFIINQISHKAIWWYLNLKATISKIRDLESTDDNTDYLNYSTGLSKLPNKKSVSTTLKVS